MNPQQSSTPTASTADPGPGGSSTETSGALAETKNKLTDGAREAAAKVKTAAGTTAARAREEAGKLAAEQKETAANRIGRYSSAIHETAQSLEEKDPNIAWFAHQAADKVQNVADYLRNRDLSTLRHDAEDLARRHPSAFFCGMFLAGLVVGNFVKASRRKLDDHDYDSRDAGYDSSWTPRSGGQELPSAELTDAQRPAADI
jgi:hypothetical protein